MLRQLYQDVFVPDAVVAEVARHVTNEIDAGLASGWLRQVTPSDRRRVDEIRRDVGGLGEAEVIAVALSMEDAVALIDEKAARACALARGIPVRGTIGVILHAKRRELIAHATPLLDSLRRSGFWLDEATYRKARELASET